MKPIKINPTNLIVPAFVIGAVAFIIFVQPWVIRHLANIN
jgi:hypothetical protein